MTKHFKTNNVIVRRFEMKDAKQECLNLLESSTAENAKIIIKSAINEYYTDEPIWAVEDKLKKNLVGFIRVTNYSRKNKMCNITWAMSTKYWDNIFMKDALTQIFNFLFIKKNIELIECSYYETNNKTNIILDEIGMTREATLRDRRINEETHKKENFVIYSINKEEFYEKNIFLHKKSYKLLKRKSTLVHKKTS